ncbi:MAG: UDP-N-acetylglucosamine 4-epimerase [Planctomycetota bacterium]
MRDPCVLVTGGAGFIGSHLCEALVGRGVRTRVLDDFSTGNAANLARIWRDLEIIEGSLESPSAVARAAEGATEIVHLAARSSVAESLEMRQAYERVNVAGTRTLLEAAARARVRRFVLAASSSAYGDHPAPHDESLAPRPMSPYAETKVAAEALVRECSAAGAVDGVSLRFFNVYGTRQDPNSPYAAVIARFMSRISAGLPVTVFGDGLQTRDFIHVSDTARAILAAIEAPGPLAGAVVNIGTGRAASIVTLARLVGAVVGARATVEHAPARPGEVRDSVADTGRAQALLGFHAATRLEDGLALMCR